MTTSIKSPDPVDEHVGSRVRMRRMVLGLSQEKLGDALGVTFQQVQKYERGTNRISASRLFQIASTLRVEPGFFFEGLTAEGKTEAEAITLHNLVSRPQARKILRIAEHLSDPALRALAEMATAIHKHLEAAEQEAIAA